MLVQKRNGSFQEFKPEKIEDAVKKAFHACNSQIPTVTLNNLWILIKNLMMDQVEYLNIESIQNDVEKFLMSEGYYEVAKAYILYREHHKMEREIAEKNIAFIEKYKKSSNTANATVDDNSNVASKNIAILNAEIHKEENITTSRNMVMNKLRELYPEFDAKQYVKDLEDKIIYKHDESSFAGAVAPYCVSGSMYPFLNNGLKDLGGLSAKPKKLESFVGMYINYIFAMSSQFAGAVATPEFLVFFDYFARKKWGNLYWKIKGVKEDIHQYFQQTVYSINQPAAARGMQSAFVNFSIFDKYFFDGMFESFCFPDGTKADWEGVNWLQKDFLHWFNQERLHCILTFPVVSVAMIYKDGKYLDEDMFNFVCKELEEGNSFFIYQSDTADSLSSCCRLKNKIQTKEFNFTNGNIGVETGSKSVISLNMNRIVQNYCKTNGKVIDNGFFSYFEKILDRVYKYNTAYNELLWDMYNSNMLPAYKGGFIDLNKQYLTIGLIGFSASAEYLGLKISDNEDYADYCQTIFGFIKEQNQKHKTKKTTWNTEMVPAESAGAKLYNADKKDGYWVPEDINLYTSYIYRPYDPDLTIFNKLAMHGAEFIGDYLDGGAAAHINLSEHLSAKQYKNLLEYAGYVGCSYFTFNVPNCECDECGFIAKHPFTTCPNCGSTNVSLWDRIIGYLTKIKNWSDPRQLEWKKRIFHIHNEN